MSEFYLKSDEAYAGDREKKVKRARVYVKQDNGYDGLADESIMASLPVEHVKFQAALKEYGAEKAKKECIEKGELHFKYEARPEGVVKRDIEAVKAKLVELEAELKESAAEPKEKAAVKKKETEAK